LSYTFAYTDRMGLQTVVGAAPEKPGRLEPVGSEGRVAK
jgi:hypothetical protein